MVGASSFSWVAQAVESVRTTSLPVGERLGGECAPISAPTSSVHRAKTPRTCRSSSQPCSATSRPTCAPSSCGSRSSGWALLRPWLPRRARRALRAGSPRPRGGRPARPRRASSPARGRGRRRWRSSSAARRRVGVARASSAHSSRVTSPSATTKRAPASAAGTSAGTAAVTSTCSAPATSSASWRAALGVELGEHVVQDQDRVVAVGAQQVVRRQPQRQRERPRLAVRGVALDRQPLVGGARRREGQQQVVAVRADQREAAVELVVAGAAPARRGARRRARGRSSARSRTRLVVDLGVLARRPRGPPPRRPCRRRAAGRRPGASRAASSSAPCWASCSSQTRASTARASCDALPRRAAPARLEQGVALLEHPVVVGAHAGQPRRAQHQQVVEEPAPVATGRP